TLLGQLALETFIFNVSQPLAGLPDVVGYPLRRLDDWTLEADVSKDRGLNDLFKQLSAHGITISSLRNKANRLEELFMRLVDKSEAAA
ncbi:MAG: ABC transporter ATP-binding protein, partial [Candidatus Competibacter denitrificans]